VLFAVLPFSPLAPALDASTLAAAAQARGLSTRVEYFNRSFATDTGMGLYEALAARLPLESLVADWVFRDCAFGQMDATDYLGLLVSRDHVPAALVPRLLAARRAAAGFIADHAKAVADEPPGAICFVDTFAKRDAVAGQLMASLAFARVLQELSPDIATVLAGPFTEGVMGRALAQLAFVDHVCTGRATASLPALLVDLASGKQVPPIVPREPRSTPQRSRRLDLPVPDFDDYFALRDDGLPGRFDALPMETSTGCWWAERSHCRFCGLNGADVTFRSKTPKRVLRELDLLVERYAPRVVEMNDLIVAPGYWTDLFPALARRRHDLHIFYETRANIRRDALEIMAAAGVRTVQAGIESLSPMTVRRMGKGGSPRVSLRFLSDCRDVGIRCIWNYLHSVPGETGPDLLEALPTIEAAANLEPPVSFGRVRVVRFSPYFIQPADYGLSQVQPDRSYRYVYAGSGLALHELAYFFEHEDRVESRARRVAVARVERAVRAWQDRGDLREPRAPLESVH
jgi:ribosomal peptide maturation radical SAM protein 1